jgi:polyisoprenoid-binding protein YceI
MRRNAYLAAVSLLAALPAAIAWRGAGDPLTLAPQSKLWIDGTSTVRKFTCKASAFTIDVDAAPGAIGAVLAGEKAVRTVAVKVPAEKMDCGNGTMNEHMLKALKATDAPTIEFTLTSYDVAKGTTGVQGTLRGSLALGGTTQPVAVPAQATEAGAGLLRVTGAYELHMKTFGLKPPSLMMGTMKVGEAVTVNFDLLLKSTAVAALER